jgi:hypothetical protein
LQKKLALKKKARESELLRQGVSKEDAAMIAAEEAQADEIVQERQIQKEMEEKASSLIKALDNSSHEALEALRQRYEDSVTAVENGLSVARKKQQKVLEDRMAQRRRQRAEELVAEGKSLEEAESVAAAELAKEEEKQKAQLAVNADQMQSNLKSAIDAAVEDKKKVLENDLKNDLAVLPIRLQSERALLADALQSKLAAAMPDRMEALISEGKSRDAAMEQAQSEYDEAVSSGLERIEKKMSERAVELENELKNKMEAEVAQLRAQQEHSSKILEDGLQKHRQRIHKKLDKMLEK